MIIFGPIARYAHLIFETYFQKSRLQYDMLNKVNIELVLVAINIYFAASKIRTKLSATLVTDSKD